MDSRQEEGSLSKDKWVDWIAQTHIHVHTVRKQGQRRYLARGSPNEYLTKLQLAAVHFKGHGLWP